MLLSLRFGPDTTSKQKVDSPGLGHGTINDTTSLRSVLIRALQHAARMSLSKFSGTSFYVLLRTCQDRLTGRNPSLLLIPVFHPSTFRGTW
jgi:hypothetical protein